MKKIILTLSLTVVLLVTFMLVVSADSVHNGKVDLNQTVTLDDGTVCKLFDNEGNALIWYVSGKNEDGGNVYSSIRADAPQVKYEAASWGVTIGGIGGPEVLKVYITLDDGTTYNSNKIAVFNIMDDDVVTNAGGGSKGENLNRAVTCMKQVFMYAENLEYVFLRLDTIAIQKANFTGCKKLKYINLEDLTLLYRIGDNSNFSGCTSLFAGQVIDLSRTRLDSIDWYDSFANVPFSGIKFPSTLKKLCEATLKGSGLVSFSFPLTVNTIEKSMFNGCTSLTYICLGNNLTKINDSVFNGCTSLNTVFFVGTAEQLNALLDNTSTTGNDAFWNVVGEERKNIISYQDYLKLEDKSGKYVVYNYSYCEGYNDAKHELSGNAVLTLNNYFEAIKFMDTCTVANCGLKIADESKTIAPIFVWKGYSCSTYGKVYSVAQCFYVNHNSVNEYMEYVPDFDYGVLATGNAGGGAIAPKLDGEKVCVGNFVKEANDYIVIKVTGITDDLADKNIVFCAYVTEGDKLLYLDGGITSKDVVGISYYGVASYNK